MLGILSRSLKVDFIHYALYELSVYSGFKGESKCFLNFCLNCESGYNKVQDSVCPVAGSSVNFICKIKLYRHGRSRLLGA